MEKAVQVLQGGRLMAIALAGIASVTVIVVALILSAAYIVTHEKNKR